MVAVALVTDGAEIEEEHCPASRTYHICGFAVLNSVFGNWELVLQTCRLQISAMNAEYLETIQL